MFCGNCGAENAEGSKFCKSCGKPLSGGSNQPTKIVPPDKSVGESTEGNNTSHQSVVEGKKPSKNIIIGVAAVVVLIVIIAVVANAKPTINLNDYMMVESNGYDGYGTARASIDWDAIEEKYGEKLSFTNQALQEYGGLLNMMTPLDVVRDSVSVELDSNDELSNGDVLNYTWDVDDELSTYVKVKVKYKDNTYTVSGLEEIGSFDAFSDVTVTFDGFAPNGTANIEYNGSELSRYDFRCDKTNGLSNGDVIKVTIDNSKMEAYAQNLGKIPDSTEKEYTVSGLDEYLSSYSELTDDFVNTLHSEAEDTIYAYTASNYDDSSSLSDLSYVGYIMNMVKNTDGYYNSYNNVYIIYSGNVSNSEGKFGTTKVYFPVHYTNILKNDSGISYESNNGILGNSNLDGTWYSTKGYANPLVCYMDIVETNRDDYKAECGDGFEVYSEHEDVTKLEDISEDYKNTLYSDAKDRIESYIADSYNKESAAEGLSVAGEYLLINKTQGTDYVNNNKYIVVYSATVSNSKGNFETATVYFPVEYDGIVKLPGDEYMVTQTKGILGNSSFPDSWYSTKGYIDGTKMFSDIVTSNRSNYIYEVSENLKEFGE